MIICLAYLVNEGNKASNLLIVVTLWENLVVANFPIAELGQLWH